VGFIGYISLVAYIDVTSIISSGAVGLLYSLGAMILNAGCLRGSLNHPFFLTRLATSLFLVVKVPWSGLTSGVVVAAIS
jgi:hypothetical protein